jgi:hypothetical protein
MSRLQLIRIAGLNIKTDPHSPDIYADMLKRAADARIAVNYRGNHYGSIGEITDESEGELSVLRGSINTFIDFDKTKSWYNIKSARPAEKDEVTTIKLPEHLRPEHSQIPFIFFPKYHRMFFQTILAPYSMMRLVHSVLNNPSVKPGASEVEVYVEQDQEQLERIFKMTELRKLEIIITRPNPDDIGDFESEIKERLAEQSARRMRTTLEAERGEGLKPDETTRKLAKVALSDGSVTGRGVDESGRVVTASTSSQPLVITLSFNPETTPFAKALIDAGRRALARIKSIT